LKSKCTVNNSQDLPRKTALKKLLYERKITQKKLAASLELSKKAVGEKVKGTTTWRLNECCYICQMLNLTIEEIFIHGYSRKHEAPIQAVKRSETP